MSKTLNAEPAGCVPPAAILLPGCKSKQKSLSPAEGTTFPLLHGAGYDDLMVLSAGFDGALPLGSVVLLINLRGDFLPHLVFLTFPTQNKTQLQ